MKQFIRKEPAVKTKEELELLYENMSKIGNISKLEAENIYHKRINSTKLYDNGTYTVIVNEELEEVYHLSIKRNDKEVLHDWRELQEIKNLIIGEEYVGVEVYPREREVVDTANQYHIWVFKNKDIKLPFGFSHGLKNQQEIKGQTKQRKF